MPTLENTQDILSRLEKFQGIESLKQLFWVDLNFQSHTQESDESTPM